MSTRPPSSSPAGDRPPAGDGSLTIARRGTRTRERVIIYALFTCAVLSVAVTVGIIAVLLVDTISFFSHSSLVEFLTGTVWAPGAGAGAPPPPEHAVGLRRFTIEARGLTPDEVLDPATRVAITHVPVG